jgi:anaerobic selenocysteine-containing dehydrogenase
MAKRVLELDDRAVLIGAPRLLDRLHHRHTTGFEEFARDLRAEMAAAGGGIRRAARADRPAGEVYIKGERVIATWGMGLTQHKHSPPSRCCPT